MYVSIEVITMLATSATILVAIVCGFGWMINRMDTHSAATEAKFDVRFDRIEDRLDRVEHEVGDVKIAIARLEGPTPRLMQVR
ncbi:response regulator [Microbacterium sp. NPDC076768]|uniref:response regulator n=1 Tax=Microbacterium sp. NPDC076768 TaxID=3154858 RepID=UPI003441DAD0